MDGEAYTAMRHLRTLIKRIAPVDEIGKRNEAWKTINSRDKTEILAWASQTRQKHAYIENGETI